MYKQALRLRRTLQTEDDIVEWLNTDDRDVVHFRRSNGWECVVNFSGTIKPLVHGTTLLSSRPLDRDGIPGDTTIWSTSNR
jgi:alpha-glucosidase